MLHQIYIVEQMNVCKGYNGNRGEQKHNEKFHYYIPLWSDNVMLGGLYTLGYVTHFYSSI